MSTGLWLLAFSTILGSGVVLALSPAGYRSLLLACVFFGLTPIGFIEGAGIPVYLPEVLLVVYAVGLLILCHKSLPQVRISTYWFIFCAYFILQILMALVLGDVSLFDLIRDMRPIAFVGLLLLIGEAVRQVSVRRHLTEQTLVGVVLICVLFDVAYYVAAHSGMLSIGGISGEFFARTSVVRYTDLMTISIFGLSNYMIFRSKRPKRALIWLAILAVITALSLNRIYAIGFLIALCWWLSLVARQWSKSALVPILAGVAPLGILVIAAVLFTGRLTDDGEVLSRVTELLSFNLLAAALEYRFVEPAIAGGYELTPLTLFFGDGIGLKFYVPWFEYRGIDPWHFSVDSFVAFAFFKYGLIGLSILSIAICKLIWLRPWSLSNAWIWLYLVVHSGINVPSFLMFLIVLSVLRDGSWLIVTDDDALSDGSVEQGRPVAVPIVT